MEQRERPLAQVEDMEELKDRYRVFDDKTLLYWLNAIKGPHREAIAALLKERRVLE